MSHVISDRDASPKNLLEGPNNFRELGGYETSDGRRVKHGMLFRSDKLQPATDKDLDFMDNLGIKLLFDFRTEDIREKEPNRLPEGTQIETRERPISSAELGKSELVEGLLKGEVGQEEAIEYMKLSYVNVVKNHQETLHELLQEASRPQGVPILFHCSAGKDRTGVAAAMLLFSLGVPRETVFYDYLLTNQLKYEYFGEVTRQFLTEAPNGSKEALEAMIRVDRSYLQSALDYIESEYQSIDLYLTEALGLDETLSEQLRSNLLE